MIHMFKGSIPEEVLSIARSLENSGYEAYLVGGCTRDLLCGQKPKDWDITTNAVPTQIQNVFPDSFYENTFGTVGVKVATDDDSLKIVEVTPYRVEGKYSNKRHPDEVRFSTHITDDLHRRDFTINAIAFRPATNEFIDLFEGRKDIAEKRLRAVGDASRRFDEDALRILRAIRLSAELDFAIDLETMTAITTHAAGLSAISKERIRDEFLKMINSKRPMPAIFVAQRLGVLKYIVPEIEGGIGCAQNQAHSFDVFEHLLRTLQCAADNGWSESVRIAALLHDVGKPATRRWSEEKGDWTFYGHEVVGARIAEKICTDLHLPKHQGEIIVKLVRWHMFFSDPDQISLSAVRRIITNVGKEHIWDLLNLRVCDRIGTGRPKAHPFRLRKYISMVEEALRDPISVGQLKIDGTQVTSVLGAAGPRVGWILHALLEEVLDEPEKNTGEYLIERARVFALLNDDELRTRGTQGKEKKDAAEAAEIQKLREKYHVS
jgi:poly(A) polymerase/tRNA nucleotidyltransferase (CCA-adding enzyme)